MDIPLLLGLADNAERLLVLSIIYEVLFTRPPRAPKLQPILAGALIGLIGILTMARAYPLVQGLVFDTRTILISVTALIFGPIPTAITVLMTTLYRLTLGGIGTHSGIASILTSAAIGLLGRRYLLTRKTANRWWRLLIFGLLVSLHMLACQLLLPHPTDHEAIRALAGPVLLIYPVVTVLLAAILIRQHERHHAMLEKAQTDERQRQQQKLEAIGTLASGVTHEINNPIYGIQNYAELIRDDLTAAPIAPMLPATTPLYLQGILDETRRVSDIVKSLLQFSRRENHPHRLTSLHDLLAQTLTLARTLVRKDAIEISLTIPADLPPILCCSQHIQQVFLNLITNARDALNEKYPTVHADKVIHIRCHAYFQAPRASRTALLKSPPSFKKTTHPDHWICIEVEDRGIGIHANIRHRLFEPFFSTKPKDQGTGLGLAISYGIVHDHHGHLEVESIPGIGTIFRLHLPALPATQP